MSTITDLYRKRQAASVASCVPQAPVCITCGGLECVCRPRFFAGQVLQADDLNRLDAYIRSKNRLHNRQLHGWGVVNGLEVTCNPCGDGVTVSCGYALSPCGEDIVVCDAVTVDICDLIRRCKDAERQMYPCDPPNPYGNANQGCDAVEEDWVLAIRYSESPARGVKPLYSTAAVSCGCNSKPSSGGCGCGASGSASSGCGCGGSTSAGACSCGSAKPRGAPVQCEPTIICEGFSFEVYRLPPERTKVDPRTGAVTVVEPTPPLTQRFECCTETLTKNPPAQPQVPVGQNPGAWYLWAVRFKEFIQRHLQTKAGYNCELIARLNTLAIPNPSTNPQGFTQAVEVLAIVYIDALLACLCSALLPPCPMPSADVRVPLALLHVNAMPCRVMRVCNWTTHRKFATTFPAIQYWLGVFPFMRNLRELLQKMCCFDLAGLLPRQTDPQLFNREAISTPRNAAGAPGNAPAGGAAGAGMAGAPGAGAAGMAGAAGTNAPGAGGAMGAAAAGASGAANAGGGTSPGAAGMASSAGEAGSLNERMTMRLNPTLSDAAPVHDMSALLASTLFTQHAPISAQSFMNAFTGGGKRTGEDAATLTALQTSHLPQFLLMQQLVKPLTDATGASNLSRTIGSALFSRALGGAEDSPTDDLAAMRRELASLKQTVDAQHAEIDKLKSTRRGKR
jgi:hypothetical protein